MNRKAELHESACSQVFHQSNKARWVKSKVRLHTDTVWRDMKLKHNSKVTINSLPAFGDIGCGDVSLLATEESEMISLSNTLYSVGGPS